MKLRHTSVILFMVLVITLMSTPLLWAATFTVTNTADTGEGTLRAAMQNSTTNADADTIEFNLGGSAPYEIALTNLLPVMMYPVTIDGTTQTGYTDEPLIYLTTTNLNEESTACIEVNGGDGTTIRGLDIMGFESGILIYNAESNVVNGCEVSSNKYGIYIYNSSYCTIGGTNANDGNVLSGNSFYGLYQTSSSNYTANNHILGNFIGVDGDGTIAWPNGICGIYMRQGSYTYIGDGSTNGMNVISGNDTHGIHLSATNLLESAIINKNIIGLDAAGVYEINNGQGGSPSSHGIYSTLWSGEIRNNVIGGQTNSINAAGIYITSADNDFDLTIAGNHVGVDLAGTNGIPNGTGIMISAPNVVIGGTNISDRNIISANTERNIQFSQSSAKNGQVINNHIGVNLAGTAIFADQNDGIQFSFASTNFLIKDNLISGHLKNNAAAIDCSGPFSSPSVLGTTITGNKIGTDATGLIVLGNDRGIRLDGRSSGNIIGGSNSSQRNIIGGSADSAVLLEGGTNNVVCGNYIGIGADGQAPLTNRYGVYSNAKEHSLQILNNVISASRNNGIYLAGTNHTVQGNYIGTDATGKGVISNLTSCIRAYRAGGCLIGGTNATQRNIIGNSGWHGIEIQDTGENLVQGNFVGVDSTGTNLIGNLMHGIYINNCASNTIGGSVYGAGNVIAGSAMSGICVENTGARDNTIEGNFIGTDPSRSQDLHNTQWGIRFRIGSSENYVGDGTPECANHIYYNTLGGVAIEASTNIAVVGNAILHNGGLGIDLDADGPTANDIGDPDLFANMRQNYPVITNVANNATNIQGTINSISNSMYMLYFYASKADETNGSSRSPIGFALSVTDTNGNGAFSCYTDVAVDGGWLITALALDAEYNVSEFSDAVVVPGAANLPISDVMFTPDSNTVEKAGGDGAFFVDVSPVSAIWTAQTASAWITLTSATNTGFDYVTYTVATNDSGSMRTGTITLASATYTIIQEDIIPTILSVTIDPNDAIADGARWRTTTEPYTNWYSSGHAITNLAAADYTIEYNTLADWISPASTSVTVAAEATTSVIGTYTARVGAATCIIQKPAPLVSHTTEWKLEGQWWTDQLLGWQDSGVIVSNIPVGVYTQICTTVSGYRHDSNVVTIVIGQTTTVTSTYVAANGYVNVTIEPETVRNAGAQWFFGHETNTFYNSGQTATSRVGGATVNGTAVPGWIAASNRVITVVESNLTNTVITYGRPITLSPDSLRRQIRWSVDLRVTNLTPGAAIELNLFVDADQDGIVSSTDRVLHTYNAADGTPAPFGASSIIGDGDGTTNGAFQVDLPYYRYNDLRQTVGNYLWQYVSDGITNAASFAITQTVSSYVISGQVVDHATSIPVPAALVRMEYYSPVSGIPPCVWTDTNGMFSMYLPTNVSPAQARMVIAEAPGYLTAAQNETNGTYLSACMITNTLLPGTNTLGDTLKLMTTSSFPSLCTITGMVYGVDTTTNGLGGVNVLFETQNDDSNSLSSWAVTASDGTFALTAPSTVSGMVFAAGPEMNFNNWIGSATEVVVSQSMPQITMTCQRPDTLVKGDLETIDGHNRGGIQMFMVLETDPMLGGSAATMPDGYYEVGVLGGTNYKVEFQSGDLYAQQTHPVDEFELAVPSGTEVFTNTTVYTPRAPLVSGYVYDTQTNGISDGMMGASMTNSFEWSSGCPTDHAGYYAMVLTSAYYHIFTGFDEFPGYTDGSSNNVRVSITPVSNVNFFLENEVAVSGTVTYDQTAATTWIEAYRITNTSPRQTVFFTSRQVTNGAYSINLTVGSDYIIQARPETASLYIPEYYDNVLRAEDAQTFTPVADTPITNINFSLTRGHAIDGRVTDQNDANVANASIAVYGMMTNQWTALTGTSTDTNGNYLVVLYPTNNIIIAATITNGNYGTVYYDQVVSSNMATRLQCNAGETNAGINFKVVPSGSVAVELLTTPSNALPQARWRLQNCTYETNWHSSGSRIDNLPIAIYTTEYSSVSGWETPHETIFSVIAGTTNVTATYTQEMGSVQTQLEPAGAASAGARWQIASLSTNWYSSGETFTNIPLGTYTQTFNTVTGWIAPSEQSVTVLHRTTTTATGTYTEVLAGDITCEILPANAVTAGAKWMIPGFSASWYDAGTTVSNLPVGTYTQTFKSVSGWILPANNLVTVYHQQTTQTTGTYTEILSGNVTCDILPANAITTGAKWRLTTGANTNWQSSGTTLSSLDIGSYTIAFNDINRWRTPTNITIKVQNGQTASGSGTYRRLNVPNDFDNDGKSDIGCYAPDAGWWYIYKSASSSLWVTNYAGGDGTLPVTGDFDGDNYCDYGTYYPPSGLWTIMESTAGEWINNFGFEGTVPVTGDFDGDGTYDFGCYYDQNGWWYIYKSGSGFWSTQFGYGGTIPFTGDFDGDGIGDFGCYYPIDGWWYIFKSSINDLWTTQFGYIGTVPITGDFDGDGIDDFGCYYAPGGNWYLQKSKDGFYTTQFGYTGTTPIAGDYDGDGIGDFGCYYPPSGHWYVFMSNTKELWTSQFGYTGTIPLK